MELRKKIAKRLILSEISSIDEMTYNLINILSEEMAETEFERLIAYSVGIIDKTLKVNDVIFSQKLSQSVEIVSNNLLKDQVTVRYVAERYSKEGCEKPTQYNTTEKPGGEYVVKQSSIEVKTTNDYGYFEFQR